MNMNNAIASTIRKNNRKANETEYDYCKRAARHARRLVNRWKSRYEYRYCHNSFLIRDVLLAIESAYELGTFGIECIPKGNNRKSPSITYLNTGDTYGLTILYVNSRFNIGSWGDIVEKGNYS